MPLIADAIFAPSGVDTTARFVRRQTNARRERVSSRTGNGPPGFTDNDGGADCVEHRHLIFGEHSLIGKADDS